MNEIKTDFFKVHKENASIFILTIRIMTLQIIMFAIKYVVSLFFIEGGNIRTFTYIFVTGLIINFFFAICILLNWLYHYYIITEDDVSVNSGFLFRRTRTFDFRSIKSIRVKQGLIGKIFNYGTIELEIPGIRKMPFLTYLPDPFEYARIVEEQRLKYLEREPKHDEVIPAIHTTPL